MSVYEGIPDKQWEEVTRELIASHPLDPGEIVEVVKTVLGGYL